MRKILFVFLLVGTLVSCDQMSSRLSVYDIAQKYQDGKYEEAKTDMLVFLENNKNNPLCIS